MRFSERDFDLFLIDVRATAEDEEAMYDIFELANVTRPRMVAQTILCTDRESPIR